MDTYKSGSYVYTELRVNTSKEHIYDLPCLQRPIRKTDTITTPMSSQSKKSLSL